MKYEKDKEYQRWDKVRYLAHNHYMLTLTEGIKVKNRKDYLPLEGDNLNIKVYKITQEEIDKLKTIWGR